MRRASGKRVIARSVWKEKKSEEVSKGLKRSILSAYRMK